MNALLLAQLTLSATDCSQRCLFIALARSRLSPDHEYSPKKPTVLSTYNMTTHSQQCMSTLNTDQMEAQMIVVFIRQQQLAMLSLCPDINPSQLPQRSESLKQDAPLGGFNTSS